MELHHSVNNVKSTNFLKHLFHHSLKVGHNTKHAIALSAISIPKIVDLNLVTDLKRTKYVKISKLNIMWLKS